MDETEDYRGEQLLNHGRRPSHADHPRAKSPSLLLALTAKARPHVVCLHRLLSLQNPPVPIIPVDYSSIASLTSALENVHTLISVLKVADPNAMVSYHSNMLKACSAANVSRFAPSAFTLGPASYDKVDLLTNKKTLSSLCQELGTAKGIECASFHCGGFLNYFAQGVKFPATTEGGDDEAFALAGLVDDLMLEYVNIPAGKLCVPVGYDGRPAPVTFTHIEDIGRFVAAAVDLPAGQWVQDLGMAGDTCSMGDVVEMLKAKGISLPLETISPQQCDERIAGFDQQLAEGFSLEALLGKMVAQLVKVQCEGEVSGGVVEPILNEKCPQVRPVTVQQFIDRVYG
ncbi:hypothetical protein H2200_007718 [Cladophialophora chaetospira]|uniref:NmrA-like domain-containing protein n=1 Tax=Cladophialophora chaetospira TaxID=386627 RepID=A0AA38X6A5_9EURO|nr:hypothetical protein H2200_007718 [Cladophialophora chaetospira]